MKKALLAAVLCGLPLAGCGGDKAVSPAASSPLSGIWSAPGGTLELRMSDSSVLASSGVLPVNQASKWIADSDHLFQILIADYDNLLLARAQDPITYANWELALISVAIEAYPYTLKTGAVDTLCVVVQTSASTCFTK